MRRLESGASETLRPRALLRRLAALSIALAWVAPADAKRGAAGLPRERHRHAAGLGADRSRFVGRGRWHRVLPACRPTTGCELWKTDGSAEGTMLIKDIWPGTTGSTPNDLTVVNGTILFAAYDPVHGRELWRSDGTAAGTLLVKDLSPGPAHSSPSAFLNVNGTLYFRATDVVNGTELWASDGTAGRNPAREGHLSRGRELESRPAHRRERSALLHGEASRDRKGALAQRRNRGRDAAREGHRCRTGSSNPIRAREPERCSSCSPRRRHERQRAVEERWDGGGDRAREGHRAGTRLVVSRSTWRRVGGTLYFAAQDPTDGRHLLWKSDGTDAGTHAREAGLPATVRATHESHARERDDLLLRLRSRHVLRAVEDRRDGRRNDPRQDIEPDYAAADPGDFIDVTESSSSPRATPPTGRAVAERRYGCGNADGEGHRPRRAEDRRIRSALAGPERNAPLPGEQRRRNSFWKSDGTEAGTQEVIESWPSGSSSNLVDLTSVGDSVFFVADDGRELPSDLEERRYGCRNVADQEHHAGARRSPRISGRAHER